MYCRLIILNYEIFKLLQGFDMTLMQDTYQYYYLGSSFKSNSDVNENAKEIQSANFNTVSNLS